MSEAIKAIRLKHRAELLEWIEARIPDFLECLGGPTPAMPVVEDFRLVLCIDDAGDADGCTYYPIVDSGSSHHRQLGLLHHAIDYLSRDPRIEDED